MSNKFNLKELRKSRSLLQSTEAKEVLVDELEQPSTNPITVETPSSQPTTTQLKRGRPPIGKRSDPNYIGALAYIRKDTYDKVRNQLFPQRREYSDLIQELLEQWLKSTK